MGTCLVLATHPNPRTERGPSYRPDSQMSLKGSSRGVGPSHPHPPPSLAPGQGTACVLPSVPQKKQGRDGRPPHAGSAGAAVCPRWSGFLVRLELLASRAFTSESCFVSPPWSPEPLRSWLRCSLVFLGRPLRALPLLFSRAPRRGLHGDPSFPHLCPSSQRLSVDGGDGGRPCVVKTRPRAARGLAGGRSFWATPRAPGSPCPQG